jgi:hypothetical protein
MGSSDAGAAAGDAAYGTHTGAPNGSGLTLVLLAVPVARRHGYSRLNRTRKMSRAVLAMRSIAIIAT